jgi:acyl-homoserine lactone acylase PvdQ
LRWNATDVDTGETYRTYLAGFAVVGTPSFTYGVSPVASFGLTAINPDISDLFVERI